MLEGLPVGIYWGSFDPITKAHEYIIRQALQKLGKLYVILNDDGRKNYQAAVSHRVKMLQTALRDLQNKIEILVQQDETECDYFALKKQIQAPLVAVVGSDSLAYWLTLQDEAKLDLYDEIWVAVRAKDEFMLELDHPCIELLEVPQDLRFVSSGQSRAFCKAADEKSLEMALNADVIEYIKKHQLYC